MRWLQWATADLQKGLGGVEVHARSLARELRSLGVDAVLSSDPRDLEGDWDVIHTHGSGTPMLGLPARSRRAIRVETLHGTTLGRMVACRELFWPGGYLAAFREARASLESDVVLSVHPKLSLFFAARGVGKVCAVCWNGWDPAEAPAPGSPAAARIEERFGALRPFWLFLGRGADPMKGADRLKAALPLLPGIRLLAAPGEGFEGHASVKGTGRLDSEEVAALLRISQGLILPSRYEGNSLVVLEALALGVPVVATAVGGVPVLPKGLEGLTVCDSDDPRAIADAVRASERLPRDPASTAVRATANRLLLPTWNKVAEIAIDAVRIAQRRKKLSA